MVLYTYYVYVPDGEPKKKPVPAVTYILFNKKEKHREKNLIYEKKNLLICRYLAKNVMQQSSK